MTRTAFVFHGPKSRDLRLKEAQDLLGPSREVACFPDIVDAFAAAAKCPGSWILGAREDLKCPPDTAKHFEDLDSEALDEIWIAVVAITATVYRCELRILPSAKPVVIDETDTSIFLVMVSHLAAAISEKVIADMAPEDIHWYGRPPYGYQVVEGHLAIQPVQRDFVTRIFEEIREGRTRQDVIDNLRTCTPKQYWDHVKIRRILERSRTYCLGEFVLQTGAVVTCKRLSFLPPEWVDILDQ